MVKAKKPVAKKGKYIDIISRATHQLKTKPVGAGRHGHYLQLHGFDMSGRSLALSGHAAEVKCPFRY